MPYGFGQKYLRGLALIFASTNQTENLQGFSGERENCATTYSHL